jgi:hypothetical protein
MTITDEIIERALVEWRKIIRLQLVASAEDPNEIETCRIVARTEAPAMRAALEAALGGQEKDIPDWKKPLYEDGKTPDKKAINEAADEFRRGTFHDALSGEDHND